MLVIVALGYGAWQGWQAGLPAYKRWKQQRALAQAKKFVEARDPQNAQLALEVALRSVPGNAEALRLAAEMLEQVGAPQAMRLRRDVSRLQPDSADDAAALVYSCLRFRDYNAARDALSAMSPEVAERPAALRAALAFALATDNRPISDAIFDRLKKALPDDDELKLSHATLRLKHPKDEQRNAARADLEQLAQKQPKFALRAYRELASNALQTRAYDEARHFFQLAGAAPKAGINEHLQLANLDLLIEQKPFEPLFAQLAPIAAKDADSAQQFVQWLLVQRRSAEADRWFNALPAAMMKERGMQSTRADIAAARGNWDELLRLLEAGAWGDVPPQCLKLAAAAKTIDVQQRPALRHETWNLALENAQNRLVALRVLQRLAAIWNWEDEAESTLWTLARAYPDQTWAHQALFNVYRARKNTTGLRNVMTALRTADPTVTRYQHDWALLSLLEDFSSAWNSPKETLQKLYQADSANPTFVTDYAFALALTDRGEEALALVRQLPAVELEYLPRQPYLAYIYGAARRPDELAKAAGLAVNGDYLPEENALIRRAQEIVTRKPAAKPKPTATAPKT